uniref:Uncharacterized protein n=1 Tax=Peronospora matthiolae TaxID=2874970 RepID=A0AAV1UHN8_9STRA
MFKYRSKLLCGSKQAPVETLVYARVSILHSQDQARSAGTEGKAWTGITHAAPFPHSRDASVCLPQSLRAVPNRIAFPTQLLS